MAENPTQFRNTHPSFLRAKATADKAVKRSDRAESEKACTPIDFAQQALEHVAAHSVFSVLAVELDNAAEVEAANPKEPAAAPWLEILCRKESCIWGGLGQGSWALFVPAKGPVESQELARRIRGRATAENHSVTIGIAVFPTLDFPREEILVNACKALEHARFFGPDSQALFDAISLNISADQHYDAGDLPGAEAEFRQALRLDPNDANLHNSMGVCHAVRGDYDRAVESFETALRLKNEDPLAAYNIAMVHRMSGRIDAALESFRIAERGQEALFESKLQIGRIHLERNAAAKARRYLEAASKLRPDFGPVHTHLGECYDALELEDAARSAYKKALRANADDAVALSGLGWIYHNGGENNEIATLFCRQSVEIAPGNGLFRYRLAMRYLAEDRLQEARHQFEKAALLGHDIGNYLEIVRNRLMEKAS